MNTEPQVLGTALISGTGGGFPGETALDNPKTVEFYVAEIRQGLGKCVSSMMALARLCADANKTLSPDDKKQLMAQLPFEKTALSKYARVGGDPRFEGDRFALPPK